ncbi:hypothetical protein ACH5RR_039256 [Cinchona calisaya]|uniref:Uncharacterized protein n=1 Tax=Cinchona calisaya TaxID=153742 RepID=A0ABD2Y3B6_9GENT
MPGLDPKIDVHHLAVKRGARPIKRVQRCFWPDLIPLIEMEVNKLIEAGFIREVKYPVWISSIVLVRKKNRQIRVCVDFRNLNEACPKNDFSLPITELMVMPQLVMKPYPLWIDPRDTTRSEWHRGMKNLLFSELPKAFIATKSCHLA